jgi:hypothetical protein
MSEVRLMIRDAACDWSGTIHGSRADQAIAALGADPLTMEELETASERFAKRDGDRRFFANLSRGECDEPYDAGLVVIDLVARLVVVDSTYSSAGHQGTVFYHNGRSATDKSLRYHLANDWLFLTDGNNWRHVAEQRRQERAARPNRDAREVFYGRPMVEFIARECFAAFGRRNEIAAAVRRQSAEKARNRSRDEATPPSDQAHAGTLSEQEITSEDWPGQARYASPFYDTLKDIHADWLLTPRDDLAGACPRDVALERHDHLMSDNQDRCDQWSRLDECPRGLDESSDAFMHGGFGTHELVKYYDLVRHLLWSCWEQLTELSQSPAGAQRLESYTVGDFLTEEVPRLERVRESWLDSPDSEVHGRTPRSIIVRERARLPEAMSGEDAIVDPDCPCCQMAAELPGVGFWHFDGSSMDDEFAFNIYCRTREEWEEEQRSWDSYNERFDAEQSERKALGVTDARAQNDGTGAIWSRSFCVEDTVDVPLGVRLFGVGCRLAELIVGLRDGAARESTSPEAQRHIDQLNRHFGNLRELLQSSDSSLAEALIEPVLRRFGEALDAVANDRPTLALQCESLAGTLQRLLDPPSREGDENNL